MLQNNYSILQHAATRCNTITRATVVPIHMCNMGPLRCNTTIENCQKLQHVETHSPIHTRDMQPPRCKILQHHAATHCNTLQHMYTCNSRAFSYLIFVCNMTHSYLTTPPPPYRLTRPSLLLYQSRTARSTQTMLCCEIDRMLREAEEVSPLCEIKSVGNIGFEMSNVSAKRVLLCIKRGLPTIKRTPYMLKHMWCYCELTEKVFPLFRMNSVAAEMFVASVLPVCVYAL